MVTVVTVNGVGLGTVRPFKLKYTRVKCSSHWSRLRAVTDLLFFSSVYSPQSGYFRPVDIFFKDVFTKL